MPSTTPLLSSQRPSTTSLENPEKPGRSPSSTASALTLVTQEEWNQKVRLVRSSLSSIDRQWIHDVLVLHPEWLRASHFFPLELASTQGDVELVKILLPFCSSKEVFSRAFCCAASKGSEACMRVLAPVADVTIHDHLALRVAAERGWVDIVKWLLPYTNRSDSQTLIRALLSAIAYGHEPVVDTLLPHCPAQVDHGELLHRAIQHKQWNLVKKVLPISDFSAQNHLALRTACHAQSADIALLIFQCYPLEKQIEILKNMEKGGSFSSMMGSLQVCVEQRSLSEATLNIKNNLKKVPKIRL